MKIIKLLLFFVLGIIVVLLIIAAFMKKEFQVEREITIAKPKQLVFDYLKMVKNQENYSVWNRKDPNAKKAYTGTDGTVGFISAWESDNKDVGVGEQEIKKIVEGERLDMELRFKKPMNTTNNAYFTTTAIDSVHTKVVWGFNGKMPYPFNAMLLFMDFDEMVGKDFSDGLANMKEILEK